MLPFKAFSLADERNEDAVALQPDAAPGFPGSSADSGLGDERRSERG